MDIDEYRFAHPHTYTDICAENTHTRRWKGNVVIEATDTNKGERERKSVREGGGIRVWDNISKEKVNKWKC